MPLSRRHPGLQALPATLASVQGGLVRLGPVWLIPTHDYAAVQGREGEAMPHLGAR